MSQPKCNITHYGVSDGLPQRTVMSIAQDMKGFMWFGTWNGLCRFDGNNFTAYSPSYEDNIYMRSNRINQIQIDSLGYLWMHTYNNEVYRFDPNKERYITSFHIENKPFNASDILILPSGNIWLTSSNMGAIYIPDTTNNYRVLSIKNNVLPSNNVRLVYEDKNHNTWILTAGGLTKINLLDNGAITSESFFSSEKNKYSFFCTYETDNEIWFGANNGKIFCYNKKTKRYEIFDTESNSNIISIKKVYDNLFVILTSENGFIISNNHKMIVGKYNKNTLKDLPTNEIRSCYIDKSNNIWLELNYPGVARFDVINRQFKYYRSSVSKEADFLSPPNFYIAEDQNDHIWIHPKGGGFSYYDKTSDSLIPFYNDQRAPNWMFSHLLHYMFIDKQGNLWISTRSDGLEKITFSSESFKINNFKEKSDLENVEIRALFEDKYNNLWMGNKDGKILIFNETGSFIGYLSINGNISKTEEPLKVMAYTFMYDRNGNILIGSKGDGLLVLKNDNNNCNKFHIKRYKNKSSDPYSISHNIIYSIHQDSNNNIWIGTFGGGLNLFDLEKGKFLNHNNLLNNYPIDIGYQIRTINSLDNTVFVGTTLGLIAFQADANSYETIKYNTYSKNYREKKSLKSNNIYQVYVTKSKDLYVVSQGGGISRIHYTNGNPSSLFFETYNSENILPFDVALSMIEDDEKKLWIIGEGSIVSFNPQNGNVEKFKEISSIIGNSFFSDCFPLLTEKGEVILGLTKGVLSFIPEEVKKDNYSPYIAFLKLKTQDEKFQLNGNLDDVKEMSLNHSNNTFSIEYGALDYASPKDISYAYKLEGLENEWIYNQNQRIVNYTSIPPGKYIFKVKSTNSSGQWNDNERTLAIIIKPSFWQTQWAYILYVIAFLSIFYIILRSLFLFYRMKDKIQLEQKQTEMKTYFYTNISHEIRTPLTLIVSPIENILEKEETPTSIKFQLQIVLKNANRMLNMVNQILDFRKMQKQKLHLKQVPFGEFIIDLYSNFILTAENKGISLTINNNIGNDKIWVDTDSIEKLFFNLLSNAIKYTPKGRRIEVNIIRRGVNYALEVKDEGIGISKDIQEKLFTRFASFNTDKSNPSTGIGLSIVKEIADRHHAKVTIESAVNKGSVFTVLFQPGLAHFAKDDNIEYINITNVPLLEEAEPALEKRDQDDKLNVENSDQTSILIVEDDDDLRSFIKSILSPNYNVYDAANGKEGYEYAIKYFPDFILSDIMMPEMDGITFLQKIRANKDISHIPVILLTAKTDIYDELEGLGSGADDYITKPFNVKLLKTKIENIIKQRQRFSRYLASQSLVISESEDDKTIDNKLSLTSQDEEFIKNVINIIDDNLDNSELTIDDLVSKTTFNRRVFYNKIKSLTGLTPVEFVREIRIRRAGELILSGEYLIKEITYMVGFSDVKYFTKCFKSILGVVPSEYKKKNTYNSTTE